MSYKCSYETIYSLRLYPSRNYKPPIFCISYSNFLVFLLTGIMRMKTDIYHNRKAIQAN